MTTRYQGRGKSALIVDGAYLVIEHDVGEAADLRVLQASVTGVHFETATRFTAGIITIAVNGADLAVPTGTRAGSDPFTVLFKRSVTDTFAELGNWLRRLVAANT